MSIRSRFTRSFLGRIVLLLVALGFVFSVWVGYYAFTSLTGNVADGDAAAVVLKQAKSETTVTAGEVTVGDDALDMVDRNHGWLQVLDDNGHQIFSHAKPAGVPTDFAPGQLVSLKQDASSLGSGRSIHTWYSGDARKLTWVYGTTQREKSTLERLVPSPDEGMRAVLILLVASFLTVIAVAGLFGSSLARPLIHMMEWLDQLSKGTYAEPTDRRGRPRSRRRAGGPLRSKYRAYREVIAALDTLTAELGRTRAERERMERAQEEWVTGVSHDLRTPLSSVRGYADLLASDYDFSPDEVRHHAAIIREKSDTMERLIGDLGLTFRLRAEALPLSRQDADLLEVAREAAVALTNDPRAAGRDVRFIEPPGEGCVPVCIDVAWFRRALDNLLINAVVHNAEGTTVSVSVARLGSEATVTIVDDGRGMDAQTLARLFDRYYRGTTSDGDAAGTGLGMAIARQLVDAHGGRIEVSSASGEGTTLRVIVPAVTTDAPCAS